MTTQHTYRGVAIRPNYRSVNGTIAALSAQRGWNYSILAFHRDGQAAFVGRSHVSDWAPNLKDAKASIDRILDARNQQAQAAHCAHLQRRSASLADDLIAACA